MSYSRQTTAILPVISGTLYNNSIIITHLKKSDGRNEPAGPFCYGEYCKGGFTRADLKRYNTMADAGTRISQGLSGQTKREACLTARRLIPP